MVARGQSYRERAFVVRSFDFNEADRIIVLLTKNHGLIRGVAKGVRRAKSRFGSRLQPFVELDVQLYPGKNLESITGADTITYFGSGIIDDVTRYLAASAVLEAVEKLSEASFAEEESLFDLVKDTIATLQHHEHPLLILDSFLLQVMDMTGWQPSLFACAQCGRAGPHHAFHPGAGGAVCVQCRPSGAADIDPEVLHIMWLLQHGHQGQVDQLLDKQRLASVHRLTRAYLQWHVEKSLSSLNVLDQA
ncbi:DNA repair protein RecO [Corynebacterium sp. sy017]|uniref:DNA repair protein RecO n=1 Tax=unclassified Corynebacterium TaxID=2624378 RepID=UPI0011854383|nr:MULTISPECIES: DNA repair protein RecO [unclassified Corynebacterium]MBP3088060.1 DNA repair protein RecO [Corynebacterium sp. sy017]QDZ43013.1 DNA repair protein RecO [Corynebacterium sp. sy039]TSD92587.1 DNA repair protein RecO [Corynebacterium sp. SY003]